MARKERVRDNQDGSAGDDDVRPSEDPAAAIANVWTLNPESAQRIGQEVTGERTEAPPPALRALFRGDGRR